MPIYEYQCDHCGKIEEAFQKISDKPLSKCGHCSGKLQRLISHSTFHLKGSGWYVTDYAGKTQDKKSSTGDNVAKNNESSSPSGADKKSKTAGDD